MPRGRSKQAYGNRTDLNGSIPKSAPTGMPYGENKKSMDAQSAVPMGTPEMATPPSTDTAPQAPQEAMQPMAQTPVQAVPLTAPTQRPNEDVLTGLTQTRSGNPDLEKLKSFQSMFEAEAMADDAPQVFRDFVGWLRNQ